MITGFNTDIDYNGVTYHVQTEDKGVDTPLILSLVYDRGTILASKRSPYDDLLVNTFDEKILVERLQKQHKLMCAAIRSGRLEDLKRMTMKESSRQKGLVAQKNINSPNHRVEPPVKSPAELPKKELDVVSSINLKEKPSIPGKNESAAYFDLPPSRTETIIVKTNDSEEELVWDIPIDIIEDSFFDETVIEAVQIIEEEIILPAEAVEIVSDSGKFEEIVDFTLKIELLNETLFKSGERKTLSILVFRGSRQTNLKGVQIIVKVIGATFRPLIFHANSDERGVATVHLQLPDFKMGRAAVLVKAICDGEEAELRRIINHE